MWKGRGLRDISIHALLAESDRQGVAQRCGGRISIHALLAESDKGHRGDHGSLLYFYPRSPCGERQFVRARWISEYDFYPRSPCGERRAYVNTTECDLEFLSTLSLRRATGGNTMAYTRKTISIHALLAESDLARCKGLTAETWISIHALLAESDRAIVSL